jgi:hypothetical protein
MVSVWQGAQGNPTTYTLNGKITLRYCGYDNAHNLFVDGYSGAKKSDLVFAELASGAASLQPISLSAKVGVPGGVQFDGTYVALQDLKKPYEIYQLQVSGSSATVVNTVDPGSHFEWVGAMSMIQEYGATIVFLPVDERGAWGTGVYQARFPYMSNGRFNRAKGRGPYSAVTLSEI